MGKKIRHNYMAAYKKGGCAVIDNAAKIPEPIYYFAYTAKQSDNVEGEATMIRIAGIMNLMQSDVADERMIKELESNLAKYEHLKINKDEK